MRARSLMLPATSIRVISGVYVREMTLGKQVGFYFNNVGYFQKPYGVLQKTFIFFVSLYTRVVVKNTLKKTVVVAELRQVKLHK